MTALRKQPMGMWLLMTVLIMGLVGCSTNAPIESSSDATLESNSLSSLVPPPPDGRVQFVADVATIDLDQRTLTFVDRDEVVIGEEDSQFF